MKISSFLVLLLTLQTICIAKQHHHGEKKVKYYTYDYFKFSSRLNETDSTKVPYKDLGHRLRKIIGDTLILEYRINFKDRSWEHNFREIADTLAPEDSFLVKNESWYSIRHHKKYLIFSKEGFDPKRTFTDSLGYTINTADTTPRLTWITYDPDRHFVQGNDTIYILNKNYVSGNNNDNPSTIQFNPKRGIIREDYFFRDRYTCFMIRYHQLYPTPKK